MLGNKQTVGELPAMRGVGECHGCDCLCVEQANVQGYQQPIKGKEMGQRKKTSRASWTKIFRPGFKAEP